MPPRTHHSHIIAATADVHTSRSSETSDLVAQGPRRTSMSTENNAKHRKNIAKVPESRVCPSRSKICTCQISTYDDKHKESVPLFQTIPLLRCQKRKPYPPPKRPKELGTLQSECGRLVSDQQSYRHMKLTRWERTIPWPSNASPATQ